MPVEEEKKELADIPAQRQRQKVVIQQTKSISNEDSNDGWGSSNERIEDWASSDGDYNKWANDAGVWD